jgi:hypothetical protein
MENWYNIFVFPTTNNNISKIGEVSINFLSELKSILLLALPADKIFDLYTNYKKWDLDEWEIFIEELEHDIKEIKS